jgi:hypothetical protein
MRAISARGEHRLNLAVNLITTDPARFGLPALFKFGSNDPSSVKGVIVKMQPRHKENLKSCVDWVEEYELAKIAA